MNTNPTKAPIDPQLFINCTLDMDYLEVAKNESLRKYEENVYLLGTIFCNRPSKDQSEEDDDDEDDSDDEDSIDDKIYDLLDDDQAMVIDQEEKIDNIISDMFPTEEQGPAKEESELLSKVKLVIKELKDHDKILNDNKEFFKESNRKSEEMIHRLKSIKNPESQTFFDEICLNADQLGILSETYKQTDNFIREKEKLSLNTELPWDVSHNIVILPL